MRDNQPSHSRKEILHIARRLRSKFGEALTFRRFRGVTGVSVDSIQSLFGSWQQLLRSVEGTKQRKPRPVLTDQELVERLRKLAEVRGNFVTQEQFARHVGLTVTCLYRRFGSWRALREAAGMWRRSTPRKLYTNRELLDGLLRIYLQFGEVPSYQSFALSHGRFLANAVRRRFDGSWKRVTYVVEVYMQEYFLAHDPLWSLQEYKQSFRIDLWAKVQWPPDKDGMEWYPEHGWRKLTSQELEEH